MRRVRRPRALAAGLAVLLTAGLAPPAAQAVTTSVPVQLVSVTDFHGYLRPPSPADGGTIAAPAGRPRSSAERRTWPRI